MENSKEGRGIVQTITLVPMKYTLQYSWPHGVPLIESEFGLMTGIG